MHVDENLNNLKPGLYCVATPIGNLGDLTLRALEIIKNSDLILCEDTRVSKKLLSKFEISKKLVSNHKFNENKNLNFILELLENNKIISIISDAGTPAISDPGRVLINKCIEKNINIYSVPGPSAVSAAISVSGFSDKYLFCGFLPEKNTALNICSDFGCLKYLFSSSHTQPSPATKSLGVSYISLYSSIYHIYYYFFISFTLYISLRCSGRTMSAFSSYCLTQFFYKFYFKWF